MAERYHTLKSSEKYFYIIHTDMFKLFVVLFHSTTNKSILNVYFHSCSQSTDLVQWQILIFLYSHNWFLLSFQRLLESLGNVLQSDSSGRNHPATSRTCSIKIDCLGCFGRKKFLSYKQSQHCNIQCDFQLLWDNSF